MLDYFVRTLLQFGTIPASEENGNYLENTNQIQQEDFKSHTVENNSHHLGDIQNSTNYRIESLILI